MVRDSMGEAQSGSLTPEDETQEVQGGQGWETSEGPSGEHAQEVTSEAQAVAVVEATAALVPIRDTEADEDFTLVRNNLKDLIAKSRQNLDDLMVLAEQSQTARTYEVLAGFLKTHVELNKELVVLAEQKIRLKHTGTTINAPTNINNHLHLTTAQLQEVLKNLPK